MPFVDSRLFCCTASGHIDVEQLKAPPIVVATRFTMLAEDDLNRPLHLVAIARGAGVLPRAARFDIERLDA